LEITKNNLEYFKRLDGVRAVAILLVLFSHFFSPNITKHLYIGVFGVNLFFVLSGFLITRILLKEKHKQKNKIQLFKKFYVRRILRIFPIYYLYIGIIIMLYGITESFEVQAALLYYFNYYELYAYSSPYFSHLWSLSIEEQFYLFWPFIIIFTPTNWIKNVLITLIASSITYSFLVQSNHKLDLISSIQTLALGGLLAYFHVFNKDKLHQLKYKKHYLSFLLLIFIYFWISSFFKLFSIIYLFKIVASLIAVILILHNIEPKKETKSVYDKFIENKKIQYIGTISYGLYLYHILVGILLTPIINKITFILFASNETVKYLHFNNYLIKFPLFTLISILLAHLSYKYLEFPFLKLKNKIAS
jgi:peptidoglycan/LPS O-acetylase OafA/YrhL